MTDRDSTLRFDPAFDANGLVTAVVTDRAGALTTRSPSLKLNSPPTT